MMLYPVLYLVVLLLFAGVLIGSSVALSRWLSGAGGSSMASQDVLRGFLALIVATALLQLRHDQLGYQGSRLVGALGEFVVFSLVATFLAVPLAAAMARRGIRSAALVTALVVLAYVVITYVMAHFGGPTSDQSLERWARSIASEAASLTCAVFAFSLAARIPIWNHLGRKTT